MNALPPLRIKGRVRLWSKKSGLLVVDRPNLTVTAGTVAYAELVGGGASADWSALIFGIGSSSVAPAKSDTDLGSAPKYYRTLGGAASFPQPGTVTLPLLLTAADYAAYGITITELGLFANSAVIGLPSVVGSTLASWAATTAEAVNTSIVNASNLAFTSIAPPVWQAGHVYAAGVIIKDSNGNIQKVTTGGTSGGSPPAWATSVSATTSDNTAVWTCEALSGYTPTTDGSLPTWITTTLGTSLTYDGTVVWLYSAENSIPTPMLAHALVPSVAFNGSTDYIGSWNLTFGV